MPISGQVPVRTAGLRHASPAEVHRFVEVASASLPRVAEIIAAFSDEATLLREAEEVLEQSRVPYEIADSVHVMEGVMMHIYLRALSLKALNKPDDQIDAVTQALMAAEKVAPYRHPKLGAVKLAADPNNPLRMLDTATADELKRKL